MRKVLVIDIDGVLADFVYGFTSLANSMFGSPVYGVDAQEVWDELAGLSRKQMSETWDALKADHHFWFNLPSCATAGDWEAVENLSYSNDVYFATARVGVGCKAQTEGWLAHHGIEYPTVVITTEKGDFARAVEADAVLDDKPGNVLCVQYLSKAVPYILDRKYNQFDAAVCGSKVVRVQSVSEFARKIEPVEAKR